LVGRKANEGGANIWDDNGRQLCLKKIAGGMRDASEREGSKGYSLINQQREGRTGDVRSQNAHKNGKTIPSRGGNILSKGKLNVKGR